MMIAQDHPARRASWVLRARHRPRRAGRVDNPAPARATSGPTGGALTQTQNDRSGGGECQDAHACQAAHRAGHRSGTVASPYPRQPWRPQPNSAGDRVIWRDCAGQFLRDVEEGQAHVLIGARTYLVAVSELRSG